MSTTTGRPKRRPAGKREASGFFHVRNLWYRIGIKPLYFCQSAEGFVFAPDSAAGASAAPGAADFPPVAVKACQNDPGKRDAELDKKTDPYQAIDQGEPDRVKIQRPAHAAQFCPCWSRRHSAALLVWVRPHPGLFPAFVDAAPRFRQPARRRQDLPESVQVPSG